MDTCPATLIGPSRINPDGFDEILGSDPRLVAALEQLDTLFVDD